MSVPKKTATAAASLSCLQQPADFDARQLVQAVHAVCGVKDSEKVCEGGSVVVVWVWQVRWTGLQPGANVRAALFGGAACRAGGSGGSGG